ncbi:site-specific integrase [Sphingobacterium sp. UT-1RO-CII-1]|uniref:tyrosine-type recombinase/integrase n=1 Tax=Sphingobacterium sp. UT-1RO-CII-1 TaxID=2995225 RepID=UPI00227A70D2|nr:site-specific integrase [Sphingobacterium sp. UT-1RO-CII-1]MCY4779506.1 site-specific integrase [Sphingobacterium sp. UT-1RO-CII-1]
MASITPTILQNNRRKDGTWLVVYRLSHRRSSVYIKTSHVISESSLNKDRTIKQKFILDYLYSDILLLQDKISRLGIRAESMTASQIRELLISDGRDIDFIEFMDECFVEMSKNLKKNTMGTYRTTINHLKDFQNGKPLYVPEITSKYIRAFLEYVKKPRSITRSMGRSTAQEAVMSGGVASNNSIHTVYFRFKKLYDLCKEKYNDEELGVIRIPGNPFSNVPVPKMQITKKRSLSIEDVRFIRDYQPTIFGEIVGKNIFMLSFYLCGINIVDLYNNLHEEVERLEYNRSKVEDIRMDNGFISVSIPKEAIPYVRWFISVRSRWSSSAILVEACNRGLRRISQKMEMKESISSYYARHSFATIARNDCRASKDDVGLALNHVSADNRITDTYIRPDWSIIDQVQRDVIDKLNEDLF